MEHVDSSWEALDQLLAVFTEAVSLSGKLKLSVFVSTGAMRFRVVPPRTCLSQKAGSGISQALGLNPSGATWAILILAARFPAIRARGG